MNIEIYNQTLEHLEEQMQDMDMETVNQLLDTLFDVKPVRLKWYLIKAKAMIKEGRDINEIVQFLDEKCEPWYPYDDVETYLALLEILTEMSGDDVESKRFRYQQDKIREVFFGIQPMKWELEEEWEKALYNMENSRMLQSSDIYKLSDLYYIRGNFYLYVLWQAVADKLFPDEEKEIRQTVLQKWNAKYYYEHLLNGKKENFAIIETEEEEHISYKLAAKALELLDKEVHILKTKRNAKDNIHDWLEQIAKSNTEGRVIFVLTSGTLTEQLLEQKDMKARLERLTVAENDYQEENFAVSRYGDYLDYIADVYRMPTQEIRRELYQKPTCRFSVIIPCRNVSRTLYYTLKTCLNQSFKGKYEIIVSDNSDMELGKDTFVYKICKELNDDRIKYYRTKDNLPLAKNYELPYLKATGEFLFSLGADDGMLPWCLEELDAVLNRYPEQKIFLWHEVTYQWPETKGNFVGKAGAATLLAKNAYKEGSPEIFEYFTEPIFKESFSNYGNMYMLPQLYHNSGIRREYLALLFEKTGVLWGGINQDISMAVTIGNIEEKLYFINNPLVINGVSSNSIGSLNNAGMSNIQQKAMTQIYKSTYGRGQRVFSYVERLCPPLGGYYSNFYTCIMYGYAIGAISDETFEAIDWKNIYKRTAIELKKEDIMCDKKLHILRYAVSQHGDELLEWFDNNFYYNILEPCPLVKESDSDTNVEDSIKSRIVLEDKEINMENPDCISDVFKVSLYLNDIWRN
ncbi:MAG: glycosyltransferase family 2 protein [Roseburia sp.]|nr:glycosyltransferase family 2 protein [Roseburia sp.]MCM1278093.1 glycosyltransferase family 2 protein [Robinsoniella sp.]